MFPLRFVDHDFQVFCYNTLRCHVVYNNFNFTPYKADQEPSPAPPSADYRDHWPFASYLGIRNFPPPAEVKWTSLDGVEHTAQVDIAAIFKDERVLYRVPDSEIPDRSWGGEPGILLEVNDRTISVYMKAFIATKTEQIPGNKIQRWSRRCDPGLDPYLLTRNAAMSRRDRMDPDGILGDGVRYDDAASHLPHL